MYLSINIVHTITFFCLRGRLVNGWRPMYLAVKSRSTFRCVFLGLRICWLVNDHAWLVGSHARAQLSCSYININKHPIFYYCFYIYYCCFLGADGQVGRGRRRDDGGAQPCNDGRGHAGVAKAGPRDARPRVPALLFRQGKWRVCIDRRWQDVAASGWLTTHIRKDCKCRSCGPTQILSG